MYVFADTVKGHIKSIAFKLCANTRGTFKASFNHLYWVAVVLKRKFLVKNIEFCFNLHNSTAVICHHFRIFVRFALNNLDGVGIGKNFADVASDFCFVFYKFACHEKSFLKKTYFARVFTFAIIL